MPPSPTTALRLARKFSGNILSWASDLADCVNFIVSALAGRTVTPITIAGQLKYTNGSPAATKFLKSDADGNAAWTAIADADVPDTITLTNITQIANRSHTNLSDIGTNAHAAIDTHISASNPHSGSAPLASPTFTGLVTTAGQIQFPATQSASADANTLDDYEEQTWSPGIANGVNGWTIVGAITQSGTYTKIGDLVFWRLEISAATSIAGTAGTCNHSLPFNSDPQGTPSYAANGSTAIGIGVGCIAGVTTVNYPPTFNLGAGVPLVCSGTFKVA